MEWDIKEKENTFFFSFTACFSTSNTERWYEHNFHIERSCLRHSRCETRKFVYFLFFLCVLAPFTIRVRELKKHHPFSYVYVLDPASWAQRERELRVRIKICARPQLNAEKKTFFLRLHIVHNSHRFSLFPLIAVKQHQK